MQARRSGPGRALLAALRLGIAACALPAAPVLAETRATLQVDVPGRAGANRHRLILTATATEGRDVTLAFSCRVESPGTFGAALDFGLGAIWNVEGEAVVFSQPGRPDVTHRMLEQDEFLALGGREAVEIFGPVLAAPRVAFTVRGRHRAEFDLAAVPRQVARFRELCLDG